MSESTGTTEFGITGPLPADILTTLLYALDPLDPGSAVVSARTEEAVRVAIPNTARPGHAEGVEVAEVTEFGPSGVSITSPEVLVEALIGMAQASEEAFPGFENYLEQKILDRQSGKSYALTLRRVSGATPHEKREEAEAKVAELERAIKTHKRSIAELGGFPIE